jgi:hypothetical protein
LRIFGPKRDEVTGGWGKLHNEELHNLYSSPSIIRMIKSSTRGTRTAYSVLMGKLKGKRHLGRPRRRWMDNIKIDLREAGWDGMNRINLVQDRNQWSAV